MTAAATHGIGIRRDSLQVTEPQSERLGEKRNKAKDGYASRSSSSAKRQRAESPESTPPASLRRDSKETTTTGMRRARIRPDSLQLAEAQSERLEEKKSKVKDVYASTSRSSAKRQRTKSPDSRPPPSLHRDSKQLTIPTMRRKSNENYEMSPTPSSPLCEPYIPESIYGTASREVFTAFTEHEKEFLAKSARQMNMPTVEQFRRSCLVVDQELLPIRESGTKAVLCGAKYVLGLSSIGGEPLRRCSGIWINWSEECKSGIALTTTHLIRSKEPSFNQWLGEDEYSPNAKVNVHLLDDTSTEGCLIYFNNHYDIALFRVKLDEKVEVPAFGDTIKSAQEVFKVGRDKSMDLKITYGRVEFANPNAFERHHYVFFSHEEDDKEYDHDDEGGAIINLDGKIVGLTMSNIRGSFIPYSILRLCLDSWRNFGSIPRIEFGLKLAGIKLLDPIQMEKIWRKLKVDDGLIVNEVAKGSNAEKIGIRIGDVIECINGERVSTTVELEEMCMVMCKEQYERGNFSDEANISLLVYHPRRLLRRTRYLTARVSKGVETVKRAEYDVTAG